MDEKKLSHYLLSYDLLEYNFKDIYESINISYFSVTDDLLNEGNTIEMDELYDYESIENISNDLNSILIKKFKLRFSVKKDNDFSNEIIVSDYFDFDLNKLGDIDSLIKIAIVKHDIQNWLNSENLSNYDFIFTINEEYSDLLKNFNKNVFVVMDKSVYFQLKNILNTMYTKKSEKFFYYVNKNFKNVFPKWKSYFKVLNSEYFDEKWYNTNYNLTDNTDPVIHYLLIGYKKGYNPGPNFNTDKYYECNTDVKENKMNPLVHYEEYGRNENRFLSIEDRNKWHYSLILKSPFFDDKWYKHNYDILSDTDCVDHYLNVGYTKGYNPGPNFSTYEYWECNLDIKEIRMNPLLHYESAGKKENRNIHFDDEESQKNYNAISNSPYFDKEWYESKYDISNENIDSVNHYLKIGYAKGYNPGPNFNSYEYWKCNVDVEDYGMNPLMHYELYGRNENRFLSIEDRNKWHYSLILKSPFFDDKWYKHNYDILSDTDCVDHYLNVGYTKGYNPGPNFSTYEYWECNLDIKEIRMNPLLHYESAGKKENRNIHFDDEESQKNYNAISNSPYFDKEWYESKYDISNENIDSVNHYLKIGYAKGYNPGPNFNSYEYWKCNVDVEDYGMNPLMHYELYGRNEKRKIQF